MNHIYNYSINDILPQDLIERILKTVLEKPKQHPIFNATALVNLNLVCKTWYAMVDNPITWKTLYTTYDRNFINFGKEHKDIPFDNNEDMCVPWKDRFIQNIFQDVPMNSALARLHYKIIPGTPRRCCCTRGARITHIIFLLAILAVNINFAIMYTNPTTPISCTPDGYVNINENLICFFACSSGNFCSIADTTGGLMSYTLLDPACYYNNSEYIECSGVNSDINCGSCFSMCTKRNPPNYENLQVDICTFLAQARAYLILGVCLPIVLFGWLTILYCCENFLLGICVDEMEREQDIKKVDAKCPILHTHKQLVCREECDCY